MELRRGRPKGDVIKFDIEQAWRIYQEEGSLSKAATKLSEKLIEEGEEVKVSKKLLHERLSKAGYKLHPEGARKKPNSMSGKERAARYRDRQKAKQLIISDPDP